MQESGFGFSTYLLKLNGLRIEIFKIPKWFLMNWFGCTCKFYSIPFYLCQSFQIFSQNLVHATHFPPIFHMIGP